MNAFAIHIVYGGTISHDSIEICLYLNINQDIISQIYSRTLEIIILACGLVSRIDQINTQKLHKFM